MLDFIYRKFPNGLWSIYLLFYCWLLYSISQYLRNFVSVIGIDLRVEFSLSATHLSFLVLSFFVSFAFAQLPLGILIDSFGIKRSLVYTIILSLLGCIVFALSSDYSGILFGRILMGLGCSSFLMCPLIIYARHFPSKSFSFLTAFQIAVGNLGAWFATAPFSHLVSSYGWREVFLGTGLFLFLLLFGLFFLREGSVSRDLSNSSDLSKPSFSSGNFFTLLLREFRGFGSVTRVKSFWPLCAIHFCHYGPVSSLYALWSGPFLSDVHGLDLESLGTALGYASIGMIVSFFFWTYVESVLRNRKLVISFAMSCMCLCLFLLAVLPNLSTLWTLILLGIFYFCSGCSPCVISHGRSMLPSNIIGRGMVTFNFATMCGVFFFQWLSGFVIELSSSDSSLVIDSFSYRLSFMSIGILTIILTFIYSFYCRELPYGKVAQVR